MKKIPFYLLLLLPCFAFNQNYNSTMIKKLEENYSLKFQKIKNQNAKPGQKAFDTVYFFRKKTLKHLLRDEKTDVPLMVNNTVDSEKLNTFLKFRNEETRNLKDSIYNYEYVQNPQDTSNASIIFAPYIKAGYVTNKEYREFEIYVKDSILRRALGEMMGGFLITETRSGVPINPPLINWKKKIEWKRFYRNDEITVIFNQYYPDYERFYRRKEPDPRKWKYVYDEGLKKIATNIAPDTIGWVRQDDYFQGNNVKDAVCSFYHWHPFFNNFPVEGLNTEKIKAYLAWKTKFQQKIFDKKGFPLRVVYCLPTPAELSIADSPADTLVLPSTNLAGNIIKITNRQYREFMMWVRDSIIRRILGQVFEKYLITENNDGETFDPPFVDWKIPIDFTDTLNTNNIEKLFLPDERSLMSKRFDYSRLHYEFYYTDFKLADSLYKFCTYYTDRSVSIVKYMTSVTPDTAAWIKKYSATANRKILFGDQQFDDSLVAGIDYPQAFAYYQWRIFHVNKFSLKENPLLNSVIPNETEWDKYYSITDRVSYESPYIFKWPYNSNYDNGEEITTHCDYRFRYVVKFFPKD